MKEVWKILVAEVTKACSLGSSSSKAKILPQAEKLYHKGATVLSGLSNGTKSISRSPTVLFVIVLGSMLVGVSWWPLRSIGPMVTHRAELRASSRFPDL